MAVIVLTPPAWSGLRRARASSHEGAHLAGVALFCGLLALAAASQEAVPPGAASARSPLLVGALGGACLGVGLFAAWAACGLRSARERLDALRRATPGLVWISDRAGRTELLGEGWQEFVAAAGGPRAGWESLVHPEDLERFHHELAETVRVGAAREFALRLRRRDGDAVAVRAKVAPIKDAVGRVVKLVGVATERPGTGRPPEEALAAEHAQRLKAEDEIARRDRAMAVLGHDLRQPLTAVHGAAAILARGDHAAGRERAAVDLIARSVLRADRMISDLLDFTRLGANGSFPVERRRCDLVAVCRPVVEDAAAGNADRGLELRAEPSLWGDWDASRLQQLLGNLVTNALRYGRPDRAVRVGLRREGATALLEVHNEGAPIPAALHGEIFEPFHRGPAAQERCASGLGLGLFIVRELARAHGGSVEVRSTTAEGTTFRVRLPLPPGDEAGLPKADAPAPARGA